MKLSLKNQKNEKAKLPKPGFLDSLKSRSFRVGGYSVMAGIMTAGIAIAANVFIRALPASMTQLDITSNQLFSISDQTEKILKNLDQEVTIYWIVQSGKEDTTLDTLLNRYLTLSDKLNLEKKDPDVYPTFAQQFTSEGIYNNSLVVQAGDRSRYLSYDDIYQYDYSNYYTTYSYDVSFAGESELTSAIDYVVSEDLPKAYLMTGHGEKGIGSSFESALEKDNVQLENLSLMTANAIPEDAECIIISGPQSDIAVEEKEILLSYLQDGGHLLLITDLPQEGEFANLEEVMEYYGVTTEQGIVVEGDQSYYAWGTPYYLVPEMGSHAITTPLTEGHYNVLLPIAQGLKVSTELRDGLNVTELLTTSSKAFSKTDGYALDTYEKEDRDISGPFALAAAVTEDLDEDKQTQIVWITSTAIVDEQTNMQVSGGNQDFFLNAVEWMCSQKETDLSIHAKALTNEYLNMDSWTASMMTIFVVGIIPICYLGIGIRIWLRRKKR